LDIEVNENQLKQNSLSQSEFYLDLDPNPVLEIDGMGLIKYINPAAKELFPDLLIKGKNHPLLASWEALFNILHIDHSHPFLREINIGDLWYEQIITYVLHSQDLRFYGRDITERKKAEERNTQLASLVQSSHDAIYGTTLEGNITSWNKGAEDIFGYSESEIVGKSLSLLFPENRRNRIFWMRDRIKRGEHISKFEAVHLRKDGREIHIFLTISPVYDNEGRIVSVSSTARAVT